jgi:hypothetical protein
VLRHPWRFAIVAVVVLVVVNLFYFLGTEQETEQPDNSLPLAVESVTPAPGQILQDEIVADLANTYTGVLVIDRVEVPEDQLTRVVDLGQVSFRPGPDQEIEKFEPGLHTVVVLFWEQGRERPAKPSAYSWTFRAVS